jgi:DNA replication protein DnaC
MKTTSDNLEIVIRDFNKSTAAMKPNTDAPQITATPVSATNRARIPLIGFPDRHRANTELSGEEWQEAYQKALAIAEAGGIIVCYGRRGTGKTQIAVEIAQNAKFNNAELPRKEWTMQSHAEYRPALYVKAMEIFIDLKNSFQRPAAPSEKAIIEKLASAAFLVIDEAHVRGETKYEDDKLTHIIDKRYDAMRPTMLITNLQRKEFASQLSPSILSRIEESGGGIECNWESFRKQNKPTLEQ